MEEIRYDCSTCSTYNPSLIGSEETPNIGEKFLLSNHKCSDDGNEISSCCTYDRERHKCGIAENEEFLHACDGCSETLTIEKLREVDEGECTSCIEYYPEDGMDTQIGYRRKTAPLTRHACSRYQDISKCCYMDVKSDECGLFYTGRFLHPCVCADKKTMSGLMVASLISVIVIASLFVAYFIMRMSRMVKQGGATRNMEERNRNEVTSFPIPVAPMAEPEVVVADLVPPILLAQVISTYDDCETNDSSKSKQNSNDGWGTMHSINMSPSVVHFHLNRNNTPACKVTLTNTKNEEDHFILFKIKINNLPGYLVRPNRGIICPRESENVSIEISGKYVQQIFHKKDFDKIRDKILVQSCVIPKDNHYVKRYLAEKGKVNSCIDSGLHFSTIKSTLNLLNGLFDYIELNDIAHATKIFHIKLSKVSFQELEQN